MPCGTLCIGQEKASKKSLHAAEQDRPDVSRKRAFWKRHQHKIDPRRLIFVDG
jgi:hypothetical protein